MSIFIVAIFFIALLLIATERITGINKAAVAVFAATVSWLLYVSWGSDFVLAMHADELARFLGSEQLSSSNVKEFIAGSDIILRYTFEAASVVLFLLCTTSIVEVLDNNGCLDFLSEALYTKYPRRFLWGVAAITFTLSANLDNLTTICLMLAIMHKLVAEEKLRWTFGAILVVAANCGGAFTVIGDTTSLALWTKELVTPTTYSATLILPCLAALGTILALTHPALPHTMKLVRTLPPYRGDDTILNRWQRALMLFVGIGGLWFIPTFHRITHLPPFLGALCVLSVLWIVDELCNRKLLRSDKMIRRREPQALQYQNVQNMLFFIGMTFAVGAVNESGILPRFSIWATQHLQDIHLIGLLSGILAAIFNNLTIMLTDIAAFSAHTEQQQYAADGIFWPWISYCTAMGGSLLIAGTLGGFAFWKMEEVPLKWYLRKFFPKALAAFVVGAIVFWIVRF